MSSSFGQTGGKIQEKQTSAEVSSAQGTTVVAGPLLSVSKLEKYIQSEPAKERREWGYKDSYLFWLLQRAYPNDTVSSKAYSAAFLQRSSMPTVQFKAMLESPSLVQPRWEFVGPRDLPIPYSQYFGQRSMSGRISGIAFDPSVEGVVYATTPGGGLWKTTDGGSTWASLSDDWQNLMTSSIAIDPAHHDTVYVGTGDFDGGRSVYGYGIQKTADGGLHWTTRAGKELEGLSVSRILIDPDDSNIVTVASGRNPLAHGKLLRSENGGETWNEPLLSTNLATRFAEWQDLKCGAKNDEGRRWCYAVGDSDGGEVLRSPDHGVHWEKLSPPLSANYQKGLAIAVSPSDAEVVYLLSGADQIILKSQSHGESWNNITNDFPAASFSTPNYNWSQSDYDCYIETAKNPESDNDVVYVGLIDFVASVDGGATWVSVANTYQDSALTHNDQHTLAVNPRDPSRLLLGNDGGIYSATFDPKTSSWNFGTTLNADLGITQFYKLSVHPTDPLILLGGAQDNASPASTGDVKEWINVGGGDGGYTAINPLFPQTQYATTQGLEIYRTKKQWGKWNIDAKDCCITCRNTAPCDDADWGGDPTSFIPPIALDPKQPNVLYAGTNYLWRWDETSETWSKHLGAQLLARASNPAGPIEQADVLTTIAIAPSDSNRIYTGSQTGQLWVSTGAGAKGTWKRIAPGASGLPRFWITQIAVHPTDPDTILVTLSGTEGVVGEHPGHVWKCTKISERPKCQNVSGSLMGKLPNIPANTVLIDPKNPEQIYYVGTDIGIFITKDGGVTWGDAGHSLGLPNVQVSHLVLQTDGEYLFAATFGRGIWRIRLPDNLNPSRIEMVMRLPANTLLLSEL